ncbi:glucose-6-phosphate dehydrogenase assembly protein OpcA [candidate division KSB1 bacterium]|nr:glucose-6-phosphate dehydrogenase assembly protein OpcA [candidate division KSB1 bacterium]
MSQVRIGEEIALDKIEAAFQTFWRQTSDADSDEAVLKAGTLNLIILLNEKALFDELLADMHEIVSSHPGRIIIAYLNPDSDLAEIKARISAFSQKSKEQTQISAELVALETGHAGSAHLAGTILPLLLADLPVYFWCTSLDALMNPQAKLLFQFTDRLIVTTSPEYETARELSTTIDAILALDNECKISDTSWARLTDWREAVAQFFDADQRLKYISRLEEVEIIYSGDKLSNDAFLMAGWLSFSLTAVAQRISLEDDATIYFGRRREQLSIKIRKRIIDGHTGLYKIKLYAEENGKPVILAAMAMPDGCIQTTVQKSGGRLSRICTMTRKSNAEILCAELDFLQQDRIYLNTCRVISEYLHENSGQNIG